jgi:hypothetical protein
MAISHSKKRRRYMIYLAYDRINHKNIKAVEALSTNEAAYYLFVDYIAPFYNLDKQLPEDLIQRIVFELYDVMSFQEIRGIQLNERYSDSLRTIDVTPDSDVKEYESIVEDIADIIDGYMRECDELDF